MSRNPLASRRPASRTAFCHATLAAALWLCSPTVSSAETVRVGGTGAGLALMKLIGEQIAVAQPDIRTEVLPSLGTQGGLRAVNEGAIQVAVALRPLTMPEREQQGLHEAACATTALVYATSRTDPPGLRREQIPGLYMNPAPNWPDGMTLRLVLRSRDGSENPYLIQAIAGMESALATAYRHPGMPIGASDQENADIAQRAEGSLAIMTLLQLRTEKLKLTPVVLDGIEPGPETLANRTYPMPIRLCLVLSARPSTGAQRFIAYVRSPPGQALLRGAGADPLP